MKKNVKNKLLSLFLSLSTILTMSGCNRKINCNIDDMHVHLYRSDVGFTKYSSSELDHLPSDYYRTDDIVYVTPYEFKYYEYLSKNDFLHIETNYDLLKRYFPKMLKMSIIILSMLKKNMRLDLLGLQLYPIKY